MAMILLDPGSARSGPVVAVFGVGLVGSSLVDRFQSIRGARPRRLALDWEDPSARESQLAEIETRLRLACGRPAPRRLAIVWSAGRAGFAARGDETASELSSFRAVLALAGRCAFSVPGTRFVHFSSAGGLFEGQRSVDATSAPRPRRPYGELKETEERLLLQSGIPATIVRLSTVYGRARAGQRAGLVSTLLWNGMRREVSSIFGSPDTLRDFVWADDVAEFVSRLVFEEGDPPPARTLLLASGRPSSIFEIQKIIEDLLGYKIYIGYSLRASNRDDITFARSALPSGWVPTDLRTSIGAVYREAIRGGPRMIGPGHRPVASGIRGSDAGRTG
jgi:UDP-glucose 4-epimerase